MIPNTPLSAMLTSPIGQAPVIEVRRGIRGVVTSSLWKPLPIIGGDGTEDEGDGAGDDSGDKSASDSGAKPDNNKSYSEDYVKGLRSEAAGYRTELKSTKTELENVNKRLQEIEDKDLSESEKLKRERDEAVTKATAAQTQAQQRIIRAEVKNVAVDLEFQDPSDAARFIDSEALKFDEDGEPTNVRELLEDVLKAKPYLKKAESAGGEGTKGAGPKASPKGEKPDGNQIITQTKEEMKRSGRYPSLV